MPKAGPPLTALRPQWLNPCRRSLGLTLVFAVLLLPAASEAAAPRARVAAPDGLNLRDRPSANATVITLLPYGTVVDILGERSDDGWYEVTAAGRRGHVKGAYLEFSAAPQLRGDAVASAPDGVRLRSGPSLSAPAIAVLPLGRVVHIQGDLTSDGWYPVQTIEGRGYVHGDYLSQAVPDAAPILIRWYGHDFDGGLLACGGTFNADDPGIAASASFPCGTALKICAVGHCVNVVVRDRGQMGAGAIDLSSAAFQRLATLETGVLTGTAEITAEPPGSATSPSPSR